MWKKLVEEMFPRFTPEGQKEWLDQIIQGEVVNGAKLATLIDTCYTSMKIMLDGNEDGLPREGVDLMNEILSAGDGKKAVANTDPEELFDFVMGLKAGYLNREWTTRITELVLHVMKPAERKERLEELLQDGDIDNEKLSTLINDCAEKAANIFTSLGGEEEIANALKQIDGKDFVLHAGTPNLIQWIYVLRNEDLWTEKVVEAVYELLLTEEEKKIDDVAEFVDMCRGKALAMCEQHPGVLEEEIVEELRSIDGKKFVEESDPKMLENWVKSLV